MTGRIRGNRYFLDNREVTKPEFDAAFPDRSLTDGDFGGLTGKSTRPKLSDALAVHPKQVKEATEDATRKRVPTEFAADGRAIIRSRAHQKAYIRKYGWHNKDGGYGD